MVFLCCYKSKVSNFKFSEDPKLPQEWLKEWKEDRFNPQNIDSRVCTDQFTPQVTKATRSKIIGSFPWKIPKNPNKVWKTLPVMCLLYFCRFSELLEVVLSDKLLFTGNAYPSKPKGRRKRYKPSMSAEERSNFTREFQLRVQHLHNVRGRNFAFCLI